MAELFGGRKKLLEIVQHNGVRLMKITKYFEPSKKDFMFNYRVENSYELSKVLKEEDVTIVGQLEQCEYGKFGWILANDGNKIVLWEPVDSAFL